MLNLLSAKIFSSQLLKAEFLFSPNYNILSTKDRLFMKAVCFDWGDTVMEELPGEIGPMAKWSRVEATPGVVDLVAKLRNQMVCCIASNANESTCQMVEAALARVGLKGAFKRIYTSHDLHLQKPQLEYFQAIGSDLGIDASDCLMVGNSYEVDANGAAAAEWNSVWLMRDLPSLRMHPLFGQVILTYDEFPEALRRIQALEIPDLPTCQKFLANVGVKPGLWRHTQKVALTGFIIACMIRQRGIQIDPVFVHRAGLLHDVDKPFLKEDPNRHGKLGAELVNKMGYPLLSRSIEMHQIFSILGDGFSQESWETRVLFLADKMVEKDRIVGAKQRIEQLIERHDHGTGQMRACQEPLLQFESEVAQLLGMDSDRLLEILHRKVDGVDVERLALR
jgi:putative hydrolase of the HAD superfamily